MEPAITLMATSEEITALGKLAREAEGVVAVSEPALLDSSRALNAGLTPEDIKHVLEMITIIFQSGAALFVYLKAARDYEMTHGGVVHVSDATGTKPMGRIGATSTDEAITGILPP